MDDLLIPSQNEAEGLNKLRLVLQTAADFGLELNLKKLYLQVDDHVHPGNCPAAVSSKKKKTRPSSYGVLPSPAELGYERTDVVFFLIF
ncbi:hypothetical protein TNCV_3936561 [Trichonephila clavipes]|nr:hypothetical protein TNCV_3936561 [Trichonephila clavipes]